MRGPIPRTRGTGTGCEWRKISSDVSVQWLFGSVDSHADPDKVTVLQIHGITDQGDNAPPLLRVAVDNGDVYAHIKRIIPEMKLNTLKCLRVLGKMNLNAPLK